MNKQELEKLHYHLSFVQDICMDMTVRDMDKMQSAILRDSTYKNESFYTLVEYTLKLYSFIVSHRYNEK